MAGGRNKHPSTMGVLLRSEFSFFSLRPAPNGDSMCVRYGTHRASNFPMIAFPCNRTVNWCLTLMGVSLLCWGGPKVFPRLPKQGTPRENNTARKSTFSTLSTTLLPAGTTINRIYPREMHLSARFYRPKLNCIIPLEQHVYVYVSI